MAYVQHEHWEARLRAEGLAPIDQHYRNRTVVRTSIIVPRKRYLPHPERLRDALRAWLTGDRSGFGPLGLAMLDGPRKGFAVDPVWPILRARILLRLCVALCEGRTINHAARRDDQQDTALAYKYLRPLYGALSENFALCDDDTDISADAATD